MISEIGLAELSLRCKKGNEIRLGCMLMLVEYLARNCELLQKHIRQNIGILGFHMHVEASSTSWFD